MSSVTRFSVSLEGALLQRLDRWVHDSSYPTRSAGVAALVREKLVAQSWDRNETVAGALVLVYDHHKRDVTQTLTEIQHDYLDLIVSSQHVHLDHHNCMEAVIVKGRAGRIQELEHRIKSVKGIKYETLASASVGTEL